MPNWRDGLVEAFPIPEDRRPGYKKKKPKRWQPEGKHKDDAMSKVILDPEPNDQSLEEGLASLNITRSAVPADPFRFLDLPSELRNRIYHLSLFAKPQYRRANGTRPDSRLNLLLVNRQLHEEASHVLYSTTRFYIFPIQKFEGVVSILDLPVRYLNHVANVKMTVGESWTKVPKEWKVTPKLTRCLKKATRVQTLRVFVGLDPSVAYFAKYRISDTYYTDFCGDLLGDVLEVMPQLRYVELDGETYVDVDGPLVSRLKQEALDAKREVKYGRYAGWIHKV